jgi:protein-S-isoprenylcysteine O-methyltransferase Ste14
MPEPLRHPGVKFPPPILFAFGALAGWALNRRYPLPLMAATREAIGSTAGWAALVLGFLISLWGMWTFRLARTAIVPIAPATKIVDSGPYRFSRNPMYLGMSLMLLGGSLLTNNFWMLLTLPLALLLLYRLVIKREEAYLLSAFPVEYGAYRARVRRFI